MSTVALRRAVAEDARLVFEWRNDPGIVSLGSSQRTVMWSEHTAWFEEVLRSKLHLLFIILVEQTPAGIVRFDREPSHYAAVSIYLMQPFIGKGYGTTALGLACHDAFDHWHDLQKIVACIRQVNAVSIRSFSKTGFLFNSEVKEICPQDHISMFIERSS